VIITVIKIHAPLPGGKRWITFVKILDSSVSLVCSLQSREIWYRLPSGSLISNWRCPGLLWDVPIVPSNGY